MANGSSMEPVFQITRVDHWLVTVVTGYFSLTENFFLLWTMRHSYSEAANPSLTTSRSCQLLGKGSETRPKLHLVIEGTVLHIWGNFCVTLNIMMEVSWSSFLERNLDAMVQSSTGISSGLYSLPQWQWGAHSGRRDVEEEVETDCDEGCIQHLPLHRNRNKKGLMTELWEALYGRGNSPFFKCPHELSLERRLLGTRVCVQSQSCLTLCDPVITKWSRLLCPWDLPGRNTGVGCHFLL